MTSDAAIVVIGTGPPGDPGAGARIRAVVSAFGPDQVVVAAADDLRAELPGVRTIAPTPGTLLSAVRRSRGVVVAGGNIHGHARRHLAPWTAGVGALDTLARMASATRVPFAVVGVGVDNLRSSHQRRQARHLVKRVDMLVLRDEHAAISLAAAGAPTPLRVGADPAWASLRPRPRSRAGSSVLVVVEPSFATDRTPALVDAIGPVAATGAAVHLQPMTGMDVDGLTDLAAAVRARIDGEVGVLDPPGHLDELTARMGDHRLVVAPTISSLIAAAAAGAAIVAVGREPGVVPLARRLGQRSVPGHTSTAVLGRAIVLGLEQDPVDRTRVDEEIRRAADGVELATLLFDHSSPRRLRDYNRLELTSGPTP